MQDNYYYLDKQQHQLGKALHPSLNLEKIAYFASAPHISADKAEQMSLKTATTLPDFDYPLPVEINLQQITIDTPPFII
jgi:hypothetical protein